MGAPSPKKRNRAARRGRAQPTRPGRRREQPSEPRIPSPREIGGKLLDCEDPLEVELIASMLLGGLFPQNNPTAPIDESALRDLVATMAHPPTDEGLAMLLSVAAVAEPPLAGLAAEASERMPGDRRRPPWAASLGRAEIREAWRATHPYGDQDSILLAFGYPGRDSWLAPVLIDRTIGNLIKDAFVAPDVEPLLERWRKEPDFTVESISVADAAGQILRALRNTDITLNPPVSEEYVSNRAFLAALVRRVPGATMPPDPEPMPVGELEPIVKEFIASEEAAGLPGDAELAAHTLFGYQAEWMADDPLRWSPMVVEICLLDWLPRKTILEEEQIGTIAPTLRAVVRYSARRRGLPSHLIRETLQAVDRFEPEFLRAMKSPASAGSSKNLVLAMRADGIDMLDQTEVGAWIERFNARPIEERDQILRGEILS